VEVKFIGGKVHKDREKMFCASQSAPAAAGRKIQTGEKKGHEGTEPSVLVHTFPSISGIGVQISPLFGPAGVWHLPPSLSPTHTQTGEEANAGGGNTNLVSLFPDASFISVFNFEAYFETGILGQDLRDGALYPFNILGMRIFHLSLHEPPLDRDASGICCLFEKLVHFFEASHLDARGTHKCQTRRVGAVIWLRVHAPSCTLHTAQIN